MPDFHFIGVGGVGMAGLAALMKARGARVTGCDLHQSPRTEWLQSLGVEVLSGHSPEHLAGGDEPPTVVVTPAVPTDNAEFAAARKGAHVRYRGEVLAEIVSSSDGIAVCGTHGKTTTSTFTARLLAALGEDPGWCIGGETGAMPVASPGSAFAQDGKGGPLVVEADESDGTLALYRPSMLVLNAVDFDHLEHFSGKEDYFDCYRKAIANTRSCVIVCADHPKALALACEAKRPGTRLVTFGLGRDSGHDKRVPPDALHISESDFPSLRSLVLGDHNVRNALAAAAVALSRGHSAEAIAEELPAAVESLPDRRFECVFSSGEDGVRVFTDYAHHPAELECAVEMAASLGGGRVRAIFQPHRYSRTRALRGEFPPAFARADEVVLVPVYPAFEKPVPGGDIADLYLAFREQEMFGGCGNVLLARSAEEAWRHVFLTLRPGDVVLIAGAGDISDILPSVREDMRTLSSGRRLEERAAAETVDLSGLSFFRTGGVSYGRLSDKPVAGRHAIVVGMGSNTWMSDLATDADVVKLPTDSPAGRPGASILADHPELSFMAGIPGTLGGWVKMNAGAFGHSIGEFVESVELYGGRVLSHDECGFAYRHSDIDGLVVDVKLRAPETASEESPADYLARRKRFPPRCCGSVFKNPPGEAAGRLLEAAGAKDLRVGGARVWEEHANVIVADDGCTSSDILALSRLMALAVLHRFGTMLEPEIRGLVPDGAVE